MDCDPQQSAFMWSQGVEPPFTVVCIPVNDVHKRVRLLAPASTMWCSTRPRATIGIIKSAVLAADFVLVPVAPTRGRCRRHVADLGAAGRTEPVMVGVGVVLTRCVSARTAPGLRRGPGRTGLSRDGDRDTPGRDIRQALLGFWPIWVATTCCSRSCRHESLRESSSVKGLRAAASGRLAGGGSVACR